MTHPVTRSAPRATGVGTALLLLCALALHAGGCAASSNSYKLEHRYGIVDPQFQRAMGSLLGPPIIPGNSTTTLLNGDQIFPAMLKSIREAKTSITFETYVYWGGLMGAVFTDALAERARAGVKVHVLIDAVGRSRIDHGFEDMMEDAGAEVVLYHALKWFDIGSARKLNNRTHRKLLVVDGKIGFTGGVGIADEWIGNAQDKDHWRDTHYRVEGPVVAQLQSAFMDEWMESTGEVLHDADYFPPLEPVGEQFAQLFKSSPQGGSESMHLMYLLSIAAAEKNIRLASSYFVPDDLTIKTLLEARARGVRVQIIVPGAHMDEEFVRQASRAKWGDLLQAGVEIYEYQPTMYHVKQMIVDDFWVSIGSSNLDNRSFRLNSEANLNLLDAKFAAEQSRIFEDDLRNCEPVTYERWRERPMQERLLEGLSSLLGPEL
jgi:cardiolipin synthase